MKSNAAWPIYLDMVYKKELRKKYPTMKVKCPFCGQIYYETSDRYDPDKPLKGYMVKLINKGDYPKFFGIDLENDVPPNMMLCIGCGCSIAPEGKLILVNELICPVCGKQCKTKLGLVSHMRVHKD